MMTKRRKFSPEFKVRVVMELITGEKGLGEASREYQIKDSVLSRWRQEFLERAPQVFEQPGWYHPAIHRQQQEHNSYARVSLILCCQ